MDAATQSADSVLRALIVAPDREMRESLRLLVEEQGFCVAQADSLQRARSIVAEDGFDVLVVDLDVPDGDGLALLQEQEPAVEGVVITARSRGFVR